MKKENQIPFIEKIKTIGISTSSKTKLPKCPVDGCGLPVVAEAHTPAGRVFVHRRKDKEDRDAQQSFSA